MIQEPTVIIKPTDISAETFEAKQKLIKSTQVVPITLRSGMVLLEQTIVFSAMALRLNPLHEGKTNEQISKFIKESGASDTMKIIAAHKDVEDIELNTTPVLNWNNSLAMQYVTIPSFEYGVVQTSADFHGTGKKNMAQLNVDGISIVAKEYLLVREHVIEAYI